jgi:hypothetical protein
MVDILEDRLTTGSSGLGDPAAYVAAGVAAAFAPAVVHVMATSPCEIVQRIREGEAPAEPPSAGWFAAQPEPRPPGTVSFASTWTDGDIPHWLAAQRGSWDAAVDAVVKARAERESQAVPEQTSVSEQAEAKLINDLLPGWDDLFTWVQLPILQLFFRPGAGKEVGFDRLMPGGRSWKSSWSISLPLPPAARSLPHEKSA